MDSLDSIDSIKSTPDDSDGSGEERFAHKIPCFYHLTRMFNKMSRKDSVIIFKQNQEHYQGKSRDSR